MLQPWSWLYVVCFLGHSGDSVLLAVMTSHLRTLGISHVNIGLLSSVNGLTLLISAPIVGSWSDIHGRRTVLCLSTSVCALAYATLGSVSTLSPLLLTRCVLGMFQHTQALGQTLVTDIVPAEKQTSANAIINALSFLSLTVGPLISGHVMEASNGFQYLTLSVSIIFILNTVLVYKFSNPMNNLKAVPNENNSAPKLPTVFQQLKTIDWKNCWVIFCIKFLFEFSTLLFFRSVEVVLVESFEITPRYMGYTISFYSFTMVISSLALGSTRFSSSFSVNRLKYLSCTFWAMTVSLWWLYTVSSYTQFVVGLVPQACSSALARIMLTEVLLKQSGDDCRGSVLGAASSVAAIARTVAPLVSGLIISWGGASLGLLTSSLVTAIAGLFTVAYSPTVRTKLL